MIPRLRTLTRKSIFGIGKKKELTVQRIIDLGKSLDLVSAYYKLNNINYIEDILIEIGITDEYRINKPGKDYDMYYKMLDSSDFHRKFRNKKLDKLRVRPKTLTKKQLQGINHRR